MARSESMPMLVVRIRGVGMRVHTLLVLVGVTVFSRAGGIMDMVVMSVIVAVCMLVFHPIMDMPVTVLLG